jgi:beta-mannosidase
LFLALTGNAKVPGGIFTDLKNANVLKEHFFFRYNDVQYRWVSWDNWTYHTTFKGFQSITQGKNGKCDKKSQFYSF